MWFTSNFDTKNPPQQEGGSFLPILGLRGVKIACFWSKGGQRLYFQKILTLTKIEKLLFIRCPPTRPFYCPLQPFLLWAGIVSPLPQISQHVGFVGATRQR